jgi:hypothetical protein
VWGAQRANPVYAARYRYLTSREHNRLRPTQAQTVIAAAILRQLHAVITTGQNLGSRHRHPRPPSTAKTPSSRRGLNSCRSCVKLAGRGEPSAA